MEEDKVFNFEFNTQELNIMLAALQELPFKVSQGLIGKILEKAREQE